MIVALSFESLVLINSSFGGPGAGVRDEGGLRGALARPFATYLEEALYPGTFSKAAALLHGLATTQYFQDGNKRTAFLASTAFLDLNGVHLGEIDPIISESFTLSVAANLLDIPRIIEWLEAMHDKRQRGAALDPRFEYLLLARSIEHDSGTANIWAAHLQGMTIQHDGRPKPPYALHVGVSGRIHWREEDANQGHVMTASFVPSDPSAVQGPRDNKARLNIGPPGRGGHEHHPNGLMPTIVSIEFDPLVYAIGQYVVEVRLDGKLVGELPFRVSEMSPLPDWVPSS
jgi:prophage maintenance system killer protein